MEDDEKCREFWSRVAESQGFDVEHLMDDKPKSCLLDYQNSDFDTEVFLNAKLGIHKYNMLQGTNLQLSCIEKCNSRITTVCIGYYITLVAKDPSAGGSLVTFQTKVVHEDYSKINTLTVYLARLKSQPPPDEEIGGAKTGLGSSILGTCIHPCKSPNLSKLVILKVAVETEENVKQPNERLKARNAVFYIRYRYYPNKGRAPKGNGHKPPRDRIAIIKRTMDIQGLLTLEFDTRYAKTLL
ncbi:hypothetical protein AXX17_AT4G21130 [Arabidopsis thaliana]|uniref:Uncharacterized protein n=1 Tax=Arabidopsis thaliana TaxID=3702 RepID=A0A178V068_ARATH|nr:hypothetical protein AXX17_AT4G21130 [Arabidopsis thaliana]